MSLSDFVSVNKYLKKLVMVPKHWNLIQVSNTLLIYFIENLFQTVFVKHVLITVSDDEAVFASDTQSLLSSKLSTC